MHLWRERGRERGGKRKKANERQNEMFEQHIKINFHMFISIHLTFIKKIHKSMYSTATLVQQLPCFFSRRYFIPKKRNRNIDTYRAQTFVPMAVRRQKNHDVFFAIMQNTIRRQKKAACTNDTRSMKEKSAVCSSPRREKFCSRVRVCIERTESVYTAAQYQNGIFGFPLPSSLKTVHRDPAFHRTYEF